jgi:hypothetical protein
MQPEGKSDLSETQMQEEVADIKRCERKVPPDADDDGYAVYQQSLFKRRWNDED